MKHTTKFQITDRFQVNDNLYVVIDTCRQEENSFARGRYETAHWYEDADGNTIGDYHEDGCTLCQSVARRNHDIAVSDTESAIQLYEASAVHRLENLRHAFEPVEGGEDLVNEDMRNHDIALLQQEQQQDRDCPF